MQLYWYVNHSLPYCIVEQYQFCAQHVAMFTSRFERTWNITQLLESSRHFTENWLAQRRRHVNYVHWIFIDCDG